jgi:hypothetical protein
LIEPASAGVSTRTRGVPASTCARLRVAAGLSAVGSAAGLGSGCDLPLTTLVAGGAAGK